MLIMNPRVSSVLVGGAGTPLLLAVVAGVGFVGELHHLVGAGRVVNEHVVEEALELAVDEGPRHCVEVGADARQHQRLDCPVDLQNRLVHLGAALWIIGAAWPGPCVEQRRRAVPGLRAGVSACC